jgi:hypothetical protein
MKAYMKKKEIEDSKSFSARKLRMIEHAREKETRRAEYDPEGFFRPGTASSAVPFVSISLEHEQPEL